MYDFIFQKALGLSETLTLNQIQFSCILQPCTKLKTKNPNPILDWLFSRVTITVLPRQNLLKQFLSVNSRKPSIDYNFQAIDQFLGK